MNKAEKFMVKCAYPGIDLSKVKIVELNLGTPAVVLHYYGGKQHKTTIKKFVCLWEHHNTKCLHRASMKFKYLKSINTLFYCKGSFKSVRSYHEYYFTHMSDWRSPD